MLKSIAIAAALALTACATAPAPATGIADTSFVAPDGTRSIQLSGWLAAPPAEVYRTIATAEGWKTWAAPVAFGELALNGVLETSYNTDAKPGDPGNIKQQALELVPDRRVVFRTVQVPAGFPHGELYMKTIATLDLAPEASGTRLTFTHSGFGTGKDWDELHGFFVDGDKQTIEELQKLFEPEQHH